MAPVVDAVERRRLGLVEDVGFTVKGLGFRGFVSGVRGV